MPKAKVVRIQCYIEPQLADHLRSLAEKNQASTSVFIRSLIIDELRSQGMLPDTYIADLFKGAVV